LQGVRDERREPVTQKQPLTVGFRLREKRQKQLSVLWPDLFDAENMERFRHIEHFGNGWGFFETPASQGSRQASNLSVRNLAAGSGMKGQDLPLSID
jgi:hypothetical protein